MAIFAHKLLKGIRPTIYGDGKQTRDFVHVDDLVRANLACLDQAGGESLNLGTGIEVTVAALYEQLAAMAAVSIEPERQVERKGEMRRLSLDSRQAGQVLDWHPNIGLAEGLGSVIAHFKEN